jgi:hypothetical protein
MKGRGVPDLPSPIGDCAVPDADPVTLLERSDVARILGVSPTRVDHLVLMRRLKVAAVTAGRQVKLFAPADVERLRLEREAQAS